jgi:P27 family predicted phage terminase small subunit
MAGRKPTARAVKELSGAADKNPQRVNWNEPKGVRGYPVAPAIVARDPVAFQCWNTMCDQLNEMDLLVTSDLYVLQVAATSYSQMEALNKELSGGRVTIENSKGDLVAHPAAMHFHRFQSTFVRCLGELGLTPSSRLRLHAPDPEKEADEFAEWLNNASGGTE